MAAVMEKPDRREAIAKLLNARAVAIIGATPDLGKLGSSPIVAMQNLEYKGQIYAVNPKYDTVMNCPCVASIEDLPDEVEAAMVLLPAKVAVDAVERCAKKGIRAIVLVSQGFGEAGGEGLERDKQIVALADKYGLALTGPNSNGIANPFSGLAMSIAPIYQYKNSVLPGRVSLISQSGGMVSSILSKFGPAGIGIAKSVTCGNELILTVSEYLDYVAGDEGTDLVVLFLETIRDPGALRTALAKCRKMGKPVVALKVGQSEHGQKAALSHTGAIAGSFQNTVALLEREGVIVTEDLETLAAVTELMVRYDWPTKTPPTPCILAISGGFAAMAADEMARVDLTLPDPSDKAVSELEALPNQSLAVNPYDIAANNAIIPAAADIFVRDGYNQIIFGLALLKPDIRLPMRETVVKLKETGAEQVYVAAPSLDAEEATYFRDHGIAVFDQPRALFAALKKLEGYGAGFADPALAPRPGTGSSLPDRDGLMNEADSKAFATSLGFHVPQGRVLASAADLAGLSAVSRPLVMKGLSDKIAHKSEHGLVKLGVETDAEIAAAYDELRANLAKADPGATTILAEEMVAPGLEAIVGLQRDPVVGPVIVVGAGGILVELLQDAVVILPPFSEEELRAKLAATKFGRLLTGYRGKSYDIGALVAAAKALGDAALANPRLESLDINPLFVHEKGVVAADVKVFLGNA